MVLCLTHSNDHYTIAIVQAHLRKLGVSSFRFNTDEFARYELDYRPGGNGPVCRLSVHGEVLDAAGIGAVWYRKMWDMQLPPDLQPGYGPAVLREYKTYLDIFLNQLAHLPWINSLEADYAAGSDKFRQLSAARACGLEVPATLLSNTAQAAKEFFRECEGNMIVKLHGSLSKSMKGDTPFFPTTRVSENELEHLDALPYCPAILQEYIPKAYELRIIYIEGTFFTGRIGGAQKLTDWRTANVASVQWLSYKLPSWLEEKIRQLMHSLRLSFGAIDMIRDSRSGYVFLEVNPQGEWGMLQKELGFPIGETIAEKLVNRMENG